MLVFYSGITNYQKLSNCKQQTFIILQFPQVSRPGKAYLCLLLRVSRSCNRGNLPTVAPWLEESTSRLVEMAGPSFFFYKLFNLFLAALGLRCCARAFSSCGERGLLFVVVHRLLTVVAPLVAEHGL